MTTISGITPKFSKVNILPVRPKEWGIVDKNLFFGKKYRKNWPCVSNQIQPHDVVGATDWLKLRAYPPALWRAGATKGAGAETVTGGLDLAIRAENRGHLGSPIPLTHLFV
jgi:hypothetical protein